MTHIGTAISTGLAVFSALGIVGAVFSFLRYANYKTTVKLQNDNIKALQDQTQILKAELAGSREDHIEALKLISNLQGQLQTYKEIPLKSIAASLENLADSNNRILQRLETSAIIAADSVAEDGLLVHTDDKNPLAVKDKSL